MGYSDSLWVSLVEVWIFFAGLIVGSFLNVCIHRLPRDESVVRPGSHCPHCQQVIRWFDNIPLLSFILLRGRCRSCRARIPVRYFLVELASGLFWIVRWKANGLSFLFLAEVIFFSLLLIVTMTDFETGLIPDEVSFSGLGLGLAASFLYPPLQGDLSPLPSLGKGVLGALVGGGIIYGTGVLGNMIFRKESMGGGDVKLMAMAGSFLGWQKIIFTFFTAPFFALPFALYSHWVKKQETIPYGPFLALAAGLQFFYGDFLVAYFAF